MICAKFDRNQPSSDGEEDENVKSFENDDDGQRTTFDQKSSLGPLAQVS